MCIQLCSLNRLALLALASHNELLDIPDQVKISHVTIQTAVIIPTVKYTKH